MLRLLIAVALVASLVGCNKSKEGEVRRIHDEEMRVTCWIFVPSGSISCVRDS